MARRGSPHYRRDPQAREKYREKRKEIVATQERDHKGRFSSSPVPPKPVDKSGVIEDYLLPLMGKPISDKDSVE